MALAAMLGGIGLPGRGIGYGYVSSGGIGNPPSPVAWPPLPQGSNAVKAFIPVARIADMLLEPGGPTTITAAAPLSAHPADLLGGRQSVPPSSGFEPPRRGVAAARNDHRARIGLECACAARRHRAAGGDADRAQRHRRGEPRRIHCGVAINCRAHRRSRAPITRSLAASRAVSGPRRPLPRGATKRLWLRHLYAETRKAAERAGLLRCPISIRSGGRRGRTAESRRKPSRCSRASAPIPHAHPLPTPSGRIELYSERIAVSTMTIVRAIRPGSNPPNGTARRSARSYPLHLLVEPAGAQAAQPI